MSQGTDEFLLFGRSKRSIERKVFGDELKISLNRDTDIVTKRLVRGYARAWASMRSVVREMGEVAGRAKHESRLLSDREIARIDRVDRAQLALERQVRELSKFTGVQVSGAAASGVGKVVSDVLDELPHLTGVDRRFTKPSGAAMEGLILRSREQIEASSRALDIRGRLALKEGLFRGLVLGENPRQTAKHIIAETEGAFFGGLARANNLARTEIADAHRYATRLTYNESELVVGWKWLAQLSNRTCPACWSMHNSFHEKTQPMFAHQSCRCTMVPVLVDDLPADHDLGDPEEIFWGLPREDQLAIMGPGRLKALEAGVTFADLTYLKPSPDWRPSQQTTNVADLLGIAELNVATTPGDVLDVPGLNNSSILSYAFAQGGLTINTLTGDQPTTGYVVARQGTSSVVDAREFFGPAGPTEVAAWLRRHGDLLDEPGAHMGMWYDTENGKVVLDVVQILNDKEAAVALGRSEDQIAIFDLDTFTEIPTGGTGGYTDPTSQALSVEKVKQIQVGAVAKVVIDGTEYVGIVRNRPSYSDVTVIELPDGSKVNAWPDQIVKVVDPESTSAAEERRRMIEQANRLAEIATEIRETTGIQDVNLAGMRVEDAQDVADTMKALAEAYPDVMPKSLRTGDGGGAFAVTNTSFGPLGIDATSDVVIADDYAADPGKWATDMQGAENRLHFHRGTADEPEQFTVDHEYGHVLDNNLWGHPFSPAGDNHRRIIAKDVHDTLNRDAIERGDIQPGDTERINEWWNGNLMLQIQGDLSGYATTNPQEMMAEAFAVYRDHGPGKSIVADTIMRHYMRAYRRKYGRWPKERDLDTLLGEEFQQ